MYPVRSLRLQRLFVMRVDTYYSGRHANDSYTAACSLKRPGLDTLHNVHYDPSSGQAARSQVDCTHTDSTVTLVLRAR